MKKGLFAIFLLFIILCLSITSAEFTMPIHLFGDYSIENKSIFLSNTLDNTTIIKKVNKDGAIIFDEKELINDTRTINIITGTICLSDTSECRGIFFYFPISKELGNYLDVAILNDQVWFTNLSSPIFPGASCLDKNLIMCSETLYNSSGAILYHNQIFNATNQSNLLDFSMDNLNEGTYFLQTYASNGLKSSLFVRLFVKQSLEVKNPSIIPSEAFINITNSSCTFQNGEKTKKIFLLPKESTMVFLNCKNQEDFSGEKGIVYKGLLKTSEALISIILAIIGAAIFQRITYPKSTKKKKVGLLVLSFSILYIILQTLMIIIEYLT